MTCVGRQETERIAAVSPGQEQERTQDQSQVPSKQRGLIKVTKGEIERDTLTYRLQEYLCWAISALRE